MLSLSPWCFTIQAKMIYLLTGYMHSPYRCTCITITICHYMAKILDVCDWWASVFWKFLGVIPWCDPTHHQPEKRFFVLLQWIKTFLIMRNNLWHIQKSFRTSKWRLKDSWIKNSTMGLGCTLHEKNSSALLIKSRDEFSCGNKMISFILILHKESI